MMVLEGGGAPAVEVSSRLPLVSDLPVSVPPPLGAPQPRGQATFLRVLRGVVSSVWPELGAAERTQLIAAWEKPWKGADFLHFKRLWESLDELAASGHNMSLVMWLYARCMAVKSFAAHRAAPVTKIGMAPVLHYELLSNKSYIEGLVRSTGVYRGYQVWPAGSSQLLDHVYGRCQLQAAEVQQARAKVLKTRAMLCGELDGHIRHQSPGLWLNPVHFIRTRLEHLAMPADLPGAVGT